MVVRIKHSCHPSSFTTHVSCPLPRAAKPEHPARANTAAPSLPYPSLSQGHPVPGHGLNTTASATSAVEQKIYDMPVFTDCISPGL